MADRAGSTQVIATATERIPLLPVKEIHSCNDRDQSGDCRVFSCHESNVSTTSANATSNSRWSAILFGQTIALALSCANAASSTLENEYQIQVPTFQTGLVYLILSFHLIHLFRKHRIKRNHHEQVENDKRKHTFPFTTLPLFTPWHTYLLLSILDVEANYLAMLSFQRTSLTSSMLFTSLSVLSTVFLRRAIFQNHGCGRSQSFGIFVVLIGGCLWLGEECYGAGTEVGIGQGEGTSHPAKPSHALTVEGDLLALSAAFLYGLNDVCAEYFVKANNDRKEYLGMLGFFGAVFSFAVQGPLLEKDRVQKIWASALVVREDTTFDYDDSLDYFASIIGPIFLLLCFVIMLCYFYVSVMAFLSKYDSTILNLSLQSCPLWAVVVTMFQNSLSEGNSGGIVLPPATFFVSLAMVMVGMFLYENHSRNERNARNLDGNDPSRNDENSTSRNAVTADNFI